ncbi:pyruvate kinase [Spirochaeta lutea]|uniref:Pyruvate kinase n=1 Tax=Spirochaeta lutea TaxID=1480694 RepID=A0A098QZU4_9SPIO|nr:pyruvate kinase [Spirochaeta lutea]KGE73380.1 pyruvate kinase [Spirochaeta lutea]
MQKQTKILATISDLKCDPDFIRTLYNEGMTAVRLNTAHQTAEDTLRVVDNVRKVSNKIPLVLDTKGPEVRTMKKKDEDIFVQTGDIIKVKGDPNGLSTKEVIYLSYEGFVRDVPVGKTLLIDDGDVGLTVIEKDDEYLICRVENDGEIGSKKSVNTPGVHISLPAISQKDYDYIKFAIQHEIDFIAHSFVRNKEDVLAIQKILDESNSECQIIAKIENQEGVDNIDEILDHVYGVMVARGDLGIEIPAEKIPAIQKMIIRKCREKCKPVITATQMLHTMIKKPRPTRAEVSDIANAVYDGTDCLMLSGETAYGDYPVEAVKTMARVARYTEEQTPAMVDLTVHPSSKAIPAFLAEAAVSAENRLPLKGIVIDTSTGRTARYLSAFRGNIPIFVECYNEQVMRRLALTYGVHANLMTVDASGHDDFVARSLNHLVKEEQLNAEDTVLILAGNFGPSTGASFIEISTIENLLNG